MLVAKIRYCLARRICRRYARDYLRDVDRMGLEWTLALIDEDVEMHGNAFNHALARAGVIDYAQNTERRQQYSVEHARLPAVPAGPRRQPVPRDVLVRRLRPRRPGDRTRRRNRSHQRHLVLALQPRRPCRLPRAGQPNVAGLP